ncbi:MAG: hypothetical protein CMJ81_22805 [Planctomycetaceae bacterium]|nr:hypothetical protein [Planctomycetaceae bacterium]MBP61742.1 hypothetical protein [Planctomycetaceae bacterium]
MLPGNRPLRHFFSSDKTRRERWDLHNVIAKLGSGAVGYTLFFARIHLSPGIWIDPVVTIIGIVFVRQMTIKYRKGPAEAGVRRSNLHPPGTRRVPRRRPIPTRMMDFSATTLFKVANFPVNGHLAERFHQGECRAT